MRLLLLLHILAASTWVGAALWVSGDVRRTLALGKPAADALGARVSPALQLDVIMGGATLVTGLLLFMMQGPAAHRVGIAAGLVLTLVRMALVATLLVPAWKKVEAAVTAGDLAAAGAPAKRMGMIAGIAHACWLGALAGMVLG